MDDSLTYLQFAPDNLQSEVPLILIHDGGGLTVSYCYLNPLNRDVYGIQNPHFYSGEPWEDGLPEMGQVYARMIQSVVSSGPVLLGGWSLGGVLSVEVASVLARASSLRVLGIVMMDSIFPNTKTPNPRPVVPHVTKFNKYTKPETQRLVSQCMDRAIAMVNQWTPPVWKGCVDTEEYTRRANLENELSPRLQSRYPGLKSLTMPTIEELPPLPRTVLLRCEDYVPVSDTSVPNAVSRVDVHRESPKLGWEQYDNGFITTVLNIPGNHFNIFDEIYIDDITAQVKSACSTLLASSLGTSLR